MNNASWIYDQPLVRDGRPVLPNGLVKATHGATGTNRWLRWYLARNDAICYAISSEGKRSSGGSYRHGQLMSGVDVNHLERALDLTLESEWSAYVALSKEASEAVQTWRDQEGHAAELPADTQDRLRAIEEEVREIAASLESRGQRLQVRGLDISLSPFDDTPPFHDHE